MGKNSSVSFELLSLCTSLQVKETEGSDGLFLIIVVIERKVSRSTITVTYRISRPMGRLDGVFGALLVGFGLIFEMKEHKNCITAR